MKLVDLKAFAKGKIPGYTMMNKERLVAALVKSKLPLPAVGGAGIAPVAKEPTKEERKAMRKAEKKAKKKAFKKAARALPEVVQTKIMELAKPKEMPISFPMPLMKEFGKGLDYLKRGLDDVRGNEEYEKEYQHEIKMYKAIVTRLSQIFNADGEYQILKVRGDIDRDALLNSLGLERDSEETFDVFDFDLKEINKFILFLIYHVFDEETEYMGAHDHGMDSIAINFDHEDLEFATEEFDKSYTMGHLTEALTEIDKKVFSKFFDPYAVLSNKSRDEFDELIEDKTQEFLDAGEDEDDARDMALEYVTTPPFDVYFKSVLGIRRNPMSSQWVKEGRAWVEKKREPESDSESESESDEE